MKKGAFLRSTFSVILLILLSFAAAAAQDENAIIQIAVSYCAVECDSRPMMAEYSDRWLLEPPDEYNHKLMQASFVMAASAFRDNTHDLDQKDFNIRNFFSRAGFTDPRTDDYDRITSAETIGSAIAHKKIGDSTLIAVAMSGNNYQNEWLNNFTVSNLQRAEGFNNAAGKVFERIRSYIQEYSLSGKLRLWITGYSRAAAVANITAADATDSGLFDAVYGYTIGTPRTTKDQDADRFSNIFNVINPFDPIPLMPFPEWGYTRYGKDLYLPAMETDSNYFIKKYDADSVSLDVTGVPVRFNPQINAQLHTILDFLLFYIRSADAYKNYFQNEILDLLEHREYKLFIQNLANRISDLDDITMKQVREFYYFLDYLCQVVYTSFRGQKFHPADLYWNPGLSLQENLMHEHYDSAYLAWLFSSDDPREIFSDEPKYIHYTVLGDADVELFDSSGNFIERIDSKAVISTDPESAETPWFSGGKSDTILFAQRNGSQTFIILPTDQTFTAVIHSHKDQDVRFAFVEYSAGAIQANIRYVYTESLLKNSFSEGLLDLDEIEQLSPKDLTKKGFSVIEPWSKDAVYTPSTVMRLENTDIFHPSPMAFVTYGVLILSFVIYILVLFAVEIHRLIKKGISKLKSHHSASKNKQAGANHAKITERLQPQQQPPKDDDHHENQ